MKQITKYSAALGLGLTLGFPLGLSRNSEKVEPLNNYTTKQEITNKIQAEFNEKHRIKGWELIEKNGDYTLGVESGRLSYEHIICSSKVEDEECKIAINAAIKQFKIKRDITSEYAPNVPQDHYRALKLEDMNNDGAVETISWPVYTTKKIFLENPNVEEEILFDPILIKKENYSLLTKKANEALYLENIIQATLRYKLK